MWHSTPAMQEACTGEPQPMPAPAQTQEPISKSPQQKGLGVWCKWCGASPASERPGVQSPVSLKINK